MFSASRITRHFQMARDKRMNSANIEPAQKLIQEDARAIGSRLICGQIIKVSNKLSKYKLMFGSQFKDCLQPRDQVLEHQFDFSFDISEKDVADLKDNRLPISIHESIKKFLVQSASNSTSAAFKLLCKGDLTDQQAKEYASKNIFLNTNSIIRETVNGVKTVKGVELKLEDEDRVKEILSKEGLSSEQIQHILTKSWWKLDQHQEVLNAGGFDVNILKEKLKTISFKKQQFVQHLTFDIDNLMSDILVNLADNFPQAPPSGGTPRMRDAIIDLNRVEAQQNDLIFANKIQIGQYIQDHVKDDWQQKFVYGEKDRDYTKFIMDVINTAINVTQLSQEDYKERTVKEIFNEFNEKLFCLAQQDKFHPIIRSLEEEDKSTKLSQEEMNQHKSLANIQNHQDIIQFFDETLNRKQNEKREKNEEGTKYSQIKGQSSEKKKLSFQQLNMKERLQHFRVKADKNYGFGQKIPEFVKQFTRQEIASEQFTAKHSSILRILTKWSEYLYSIFLHPQKAVLGRTTNFKTIDHKFVLLDSSDKGKTKFINQLKAEHEKVKKKYEEIAKNCYRLMGQLLSQQSQASSSCVSRYSDTRVVASKINAILIHHMLSYTNILIHHLLRAGQMIYTNYGEQAINLIVFRVSDLLRAKLQCNESSFISLLKTMYLLDKHPEMKDKFKLVRIKSKLDDPANNIMINYLFMGKVQCELQLSIQQPKGKAKNYYAFSHFVYQLTRGKFGSIAECAIMISQLDPMIVSCQQNYYSEKKGNRIINMREKALKQTEGSFENRLKTSVFECSEQQCKKIIINQNQNMFLDEGRQKICNRCIIKSQSPQEKLKDQKVKMFLKSKELKRMLNLKELQVNQKLKYIVVLSNQGKLAFNISVFVKEELKTFVVRLDSQIMQQLDANNIDFSTLDYFDVSKNIAALKDQQKQQLMFIIQDLAGVSEELYQLMDFKTKPSLEKLIEISEEFKQFRLEKALIKTIKFNTTVLNTELNLQKWRTLEYIVEELAAPSDYQKTKQIRLRYRKYKRLDLSSINQIYARNLASSKQKQDKLTELPKWFSWMKNLKQAILNTNSLTKITKDQLPSSLELINFGWNKISEFDISHLTHLKIAHLAGNKITAIQPRYFNQFSHLQQLYLQRNQLKQINISDINSLQNLNLTGNLLETADIVNLYNLKQLYLTFNKLKRMNLTNLNSIITINLIKCGLTAIDLAQYPTVKELFLGQNQFKELDLSPLKHLTELYLYKTNLDSFELLNNPNLKVLNLRKNRLKSVDLRAFRGLTNLNISQNKLQAVDISNLLNLKSLFLNNNKIEVLDLSNHRHIKQLYVYNNQIKELDLSNLSDLTVMSIHKNKLEKVKFSKKYLNISNLYLSNNQFKEIDLSPFINLTQFGIYENQLQRIDLSHNPKLQFVDMNKNLLSELDVSSLSNLIKLTLFENKLKQLDVRNLKGLNSLYLQKNQISRLYFKNNTSLQLLQIEENQLVDIQYLPESIQQLLADRKAIINYNFEGMTKITKLTIFNGETKREELKNLKAGEIKFSNEK